MGALLKLAVSCGYGALREIRNLGAAAVVGFGLAGAASAEPVTLVVLGDSLTQGYGLAPTDGFVSQMAARLEDEGAEVDLRNAGVSGDTTAGGLARIDWSLDDDVDGLIVALGGNDLLRGLDPAASRANLKGILEAAGARDLPVLLVGMEAPGNFGPEYKAAFDNMYPELAAEFGALHFPNFLQGLAELEDRAAAIETYFQADRIHPNRDGVALIVAAMGPAFLELAQAAGGKITH
ncbi:MAG: arylesterase [Pseudomonadota bacterium]